MKRTLLILLAGLSAPLFASRSLDKQYGFRHVAAAVIGADQQAVYGEAVENALVRALRQSSRFEPSDAGYLFLKKSLKALGSFPLIHGRAAELVTLGPTLKALALQKVQCVVLGEVTQTDEGYQVRLSLLTTANPEKIAQVDTPVEGDSLPAFSSAVRKGLARLTEAIPFEASILSREGYRVIFDRGKGFFHRGQQISVYTLERSATDLIYVETGVVAITRAEKDLSFGKILAERQPLEVAEGNKVHGTLGSYIGPLPGAGRPPSLADYEKGPGIALGFVDLSLGVSSMTWANSAASGDGVYSTSGVYSGGEVLAELFVTSHWFVDLGFAAAAATLGGSSGQAAVNLNSSTSRLQARLGYRIDFPALSPSPSMYLRGGYASQQLNVDASSTPLFLTNLQYQGFLIGVGARVPISNRFGLGMDLDTLLFGSVSETPVTSGSSVGSVSWWSIGLRGSYRLNPAMEADAKFLVGSNDVGFSGVGTRSQPLSSSSQSSQALLVGVSYYF